jgi:hypothetical protein
VVFRSSTAQSLGDKGTVLLSTIDETLLGRGLGKIDKRTDLPFLLFSALSAEKVFNPYP